MSPRGAAVLTLLVLLVVLGAAIAVTTPWGSPLGGATGATVSAAAATDFTPAEQALARAYRGEVRPPAYVSLVVGLAVALGLGLTPAGARLVQAVAAPVGGAWWAQVVLGTVAVTTVARLASLPFDARAEAVSRRYGLSTRSWGGWLADVGRGWLVATALLVLLLVVLYGLLRAMPRWWWAPAAAGAALAVLLASFAYPLVVEPVFNRFTPMPAGDLRASLLELADRDGVRVDDVLVADASRRTSSLNAYVSGFGATRRIVVYDTLLEQAEPEEVRLIVAHELGHVRRDDVLRGTALGALGLAAAVCLLYLALSPPALSPPALSPPVLLRRAGVDRLADPRSLALVVAAVVVLTTVTGPVQALLSRRIESRADVHSLDLTRDPAAFVAMQRRLALANLSDPDPPPLVFALFATHPTAPMRIAAARAWAGAEGVPVPEPLAP